MIRLVCNRRVATWFASLVVLSLFTSQASAHYLWVTINAGLGAHGTAQLYFEGGPSPGDGQHLDPFVQRGKTWIRTVEQTRPTPLRTADTKDGKKRWLSASLQSTAPRSIESYGKWGVYKYGETDVLLHYYARHLDVNDHDDLHELARAEQLALDMVPHDDGSKMELKVLWNGKPAAGRPIAVRGPQGFSETLKTDADGVAHFTKKGDGSYTFRTSVEEKKSGTFEGKDYQRVRHHMTLILKLPLAGL